MLWTRVRDGVLRIPQFTGYSLKYYQMGVGSELITYLPADFQTPVGLDRNPFRDGIWEMR